MVVLPHKLGVIGVAVDAPLQRIAGQRQHGVDLIAPLSGP
jgi:hypothetical protein